MENDNYRFKIDRVKWKTAVDAVLAKRERMHAEVEKKYWSAQDYYLSIELTKLYSIRAHARGRVHRTTAKLNQYEWNKLGYKTPGYKEFTEANGRIKFALTIVDQATYLGDSWKEYEKKEDCLRCKHSHFDDAGNFLIGKCPLAYEIGIICECTGYVD